MKPFRCILAPEGYLENEVFSFNSPEEREAFSLGVHLGSNHYGCGSMYLIFEENLEEQIAELCEETENYSVEEALKLAKSSFEAKE